MTQVKKKTKILGLAIIFFLCFPLLAQEEDASLLTLDKIFSEEFEAKSLGDVVWLDDGSRYTMLKPSESLKSSQDIVQYDPETGKKEVLVPGWRLIPPGKSSPIKIDRYSWSKNESRLLLSTNVKSQGRRDSSSDCWILDLGIWSWRQLGEDAPPQSLKDAKFSPDGNRVSYIIDNNLYVEDLTYFNITQLTEDGSEKLLNGKSKSCNRSMLNSRGGYSSGRDGYTWSPDGKSIAYVQLDMQDVPDFYMINSTETLYPKIIKFPYVKVGKKMPSYRVGIVSAEGGETLWMKIPGVPSDDYLWQMEWAASSSELVVQVLNRRQNTMQVMLADAQTGDVRTILTESDEAWIEPNSIIWLEGGKKFTWKSERNGWQHVYIYTRSGKEIGSITSGQFDVLSLLGVDKKNGWLYYMASPENPTQRYLFRSPLNGKGKPEKVTPSESVGTNSYQVSPDCQWAIHTFSTINSPLVYSLVRFPEHKTLRILEDNAELRERISKLKRVPTEFFRVDIGEGLKLDGYCIKPPDMNSEKQYPLFFYIYGEPAGQTVLDRWSGRRHLWYLMLAQQGYVVMSVDPRGTPAPRGRAWRKVIYRKLGIQAALDHAAATRAIIKERAYIDRDRIGIYGHSGGGQMSLNLIFRYPDLYSLAMPSSFVSDQRFYHPGYQERFMGLLEDNVDGYQKGSPKTWAHRLKGNLLIIHGTGDSNVHYQSFEALVNELVAHKKRFTMMVYPNRNHGLREGQNTQYHLYDLRTHFLKTNMPPGPKSQQKN